MLDMQQGYTKSNPPNSLINLGFAEVDLTSKFDSFGEEILLMYAFQLYALTISNDEHSHSSP